jgi:M-phase inducer tyrosine phosphatase
LKLDELLDGNYDSQIADYHVVDCRFDYEYNGGHIFGAVNINTTNGVEEFLLGSASTKPKQSVSGDPAKKTVVVFHCEFSVKRAPTLYVVLSFSLWFPLIMKTFRSAKHLRSKDRAMNNHVYPRIHYPEVYILEGGYCQYFKRSANRCEPSAYVTMDDPNHATSRREDLDQFRKARFGRTKSYAYGDGTVKVNMMSQQTQQQHKRNATSSGGPNALFAAAAAAHTRRVGPLTTLAEDGNITAHSDGDETDDLGDSPCPPPTKASAFKGKKIGRAPLTRAETYGPASMGY